jgi:hypothetical protein
MLLEYIEFIPGLANYRVGDPRRFLVERQMKERTQRRPTLVITPRTSDVHREYA